MKSSTTVTGLRKASQQPRQKNGGEVPQNGVDLVGGDQREEVSGAVQREEATQSLAGDEEPSWRGRRDLNLVLRRKPTAGNNFAVVRKKQKNRKPFCSFSSSISNRSRLRKAVTAGMTLVGPRGLTIEKGMLKHWRVKCENCRCEQASSILTRDALTLIPVSGIGTEDQ